MFRYNSNDIRRSFSNDNMAGDLYILFFPIWKRAIA
jgi:hypothetical protein